MRGRVLLVVSHAKVPNIRMNASLRRRCLYNRKHLVPKPYPWLIALAEHGANAVDAAVSATVPAMHIMLR